jgi:hypothetical protein
MYAEVARRCARGGLTNVAGVLNGIPAEFVTGVGRNRYDAETLHDASIIGLTVAGIAACHGTEEILSAFLSCLISAERDLSEPPKRSSQRLGDLLGTRDALPPLPPEPTWLAKFNYPNSSKQRQLTSVASKQLLRLLLESEPVGFKDLRSSAGGHWAASFDQRVITFANVRNLNDYWFLRPKQPRGLVRLNQKEQSKARLITHPGLLVTTLLEWIYRSSDGNTTRAVWPQSFFHPDIDPEIIDEALHQLELEGKVRFAASASPQDIVEELMAKGPAVMLTEVGIAHIKESRVLRDRAARNALLAFAYQEKGKGILQIPEDFLTSSFSSMTGHRFSADDVLSASEYLLDKDLVVGDDRYVESARARGIKRLTASGYDCIEKGGDVAEYLKNSEQSSKYQITANANTGNLIIGDQRTVKITQGTDVEGLSTLMQAVLQALPVLGLEDRAGEEARTAADQIIDEIQKTPPDRSRWSRAAYSLRRTLTSSAQQALAAVLVGVVDYELAKAGLPPGHQ